MMAPGSRRLGLMMGALCVPLAAVAAVNWLVNPYGAWRTALVDPIYQRQLPGSERVQVPYRVRTERPATVLLGSSRVLIGMPIEQGCRDHVMNAALSGATLDEIGAIIRLAIANPRLRRVVWGVDFTTFNEHWSGFLHAPTYLRLRRDTRLLVQETLLSMEAIDASRHALLTALHGPAELPSTWQLPVPWPESVIRRSLDELQAAPLDASRAAERDLIAGQWADIYSTYQLSAAQVDLFRELVGVIRRAGLELILFVPPFSEYELELIRQTGRWETFQRWKRELATVASYWDFSGYDELARTDAYFDPVGFCHFEPPVGEAVLRHVLGQSCDACGAAARRIASAGVWVDTSTVEAHLQMQDAERFARQQQGSPQARYVAGIVHAAQYAADHASP